MIVYQTDKNGFYVGPVEADESPLEPGVYLIPAGCVEAEPPSNSNPNYALQFVNGQWEKVLSLPDPEADEDDPEPTRGGKVTAAQAKLALDDASLLDTVEATVAAHPVRAVKIWYDNANTWERGNPYVQALAIELGLSEEAVDALFIAASKK